MDWYVAYVTIEKDHEYSYNNPFPPVLLKNETFFEVLKEVLSILYPKENPRNGRWERNKGPLTFEEAATKGEETSDR